MYPSADASLCPNCHKRPADTLLEYDEVIAFDYQARSWTRRRRQISWSQTSVSGKVMLCRECAAAYARSVALRRIGHRFTNIGMALIGVGFVTYFAAVLLNTDLHLSPAQLIPLAPAVIGLVSLVVGLGIELSGRMIRHSATRFLANR
jgi:hypothetical protein